MRPCRHATTQPGAFNGTGCNTAAISAEHLRQPQQQRAENQRICPASWHLPPAAFSLFTAFCLLPSVCYTHRENWPNCNSLRCADVIFEGASETAGEANRF